MIENFTFSQFLRNSITRMIYGRSLRRIYRLPVPNVIQRRTNANIWLFYPQEKEDL